MHFQLNLSYQHMEAENSEFPAILQHGSISLVAKSS